MGTYLTGEVSVIHAEADVDFENFAYSAIFANNAGTYQINGTNMILVAGRVVNVVVQENGTTLDGTKFLLMGNPIAPQTKVKTGLISGTTETFDNNIGIVETYQYVDIKTGNPIQS
mgnify:CR=1 FL=1|tara:strand:- start:625 stop:972 length:348 start_codon:yes stop_codon:yes gene_type:complete